MRVRKVSNPGQAYHAIVVFIVEVHSALGYEDIANMKMYQIEQRYSSQQVEQMSRLRIYDKLKATHERPVNVLDYNEYRKLEEKRDRILLKKTLYDQKKQNDESQVSLLNGDLTETKASKDELNNMVSSLKRQLAKVQKDIVDIDKNRKKEVQKVEQQKRRDIIKRAGAKPPTKTTGSEGRSKRKSPDSRFKARGSPTSKEISYKKSKKKSPSKSPKNKGERLRQRSSQAMRTA